MQHKKIEERSHRLNGETKIITPFVNYRSIKEAPQDVQQTIDFVKEIHKRIFLILQLTGKYTKVSFYKVNLTFLTVVWLAVCEGANFFESVLETAYLLC